MCAFLLCRKNCRSRDIPRWARHLFCAGSSGAAEVRLELNVGIVPVRFTQPESSALAFGEMTQMVPEFGGDSRCGGGCRRYELERRATLPARRRSRRFPPVLLTRSCQCARSRRCRDFDWMCRARSNIWIASGGKFFYFRQPRDREPESSSACAHDFLQRRRSGDRFGGGMRVGVDGCTRHCGER